MELKNLNGESLKWPGPPNLRRLFPQLWYAMRFHDIFCRKCGTRKVAPIDMLHSGMMLRVAL